MRRSLRSTSTSPASWERSDSRPTDASSTTMISCAGSSAWAAMPSKQRKACAGPPANGTMIETFEDILPG